LLLLLLTSINELAVWKASKRVDKPAQGLAGEGVFEDLSIE